jgi:hypothetical protein
MLIKGRSEPEGGWALKSNFLAPGLKAAKKLGEGEEFEWAFLEFRAFVMQGFG